MVSFASSLSMLEIPLSQIFLLSLFAACKIFRILSLLKWMPVVENPVRWNYFTFKSDTTGRHRELSWLSMLLEEQIFFTVRHQSLGFAEILDIFVLFEAGAHQNGFVAVSRSVNLCFCYSAYIIFVNIATIDNGN